MPLAIVSAPANGHAFRIRKTSSSRATTLATLKTLYNRAASAFLQRDMQLTQSLLDSAWSLIKPPISSVLDELDELRRKWDILRITLVATVYSNPPNSCPENLANYLADPPSLVSLRLFSESVALFTPSTEHKPSPAYVPASVLTAHVYSSLKLDTPTVARTMIEDWLAYRDDDEDHMEEYEKILDLYILQVLPRLDEWDYAKEFLDYEMQLEPQARQRLRSSLYALLDQSKRSVAQAGLVQSSFVGTSTPMGSTSRAHSPTPSSSSSSSLSTITSQRTVVPSTPRPLTSHALSALQTSTSMVSLPRSRAESSITSNDTVTRPFLSTSTAPTTNENSPPSSTSRQKSPERIGRNTNGHISQTSLVAASPFSHRHNLSSDKPFSLSNGHGHPRHLSTFHAVYDFLRGYLEPYMSARNIATVLLFFVVIPLFSLVLRVRRRKTITVGGGGNNVSLARKRLQNGATSRSVLGGLVRGVFDFVQMAQSGLV